MPYQPYTRNLAPTTTVAHPMHCCGAMELDYLGVSKTPLEALAACAESLWKGKMMASDGHTAPRFVVFTGVPQMKSKPYCSGHDGRRIDDYGQAFADYLVEHGLGSVISTPTMTNWTANDIKMWVWTVDRDALWSHLGQHGIKFKHEPPVEDDDDDDERYDDDED